jgi:hypothetical protein
MANCERAKVWRKTSHCRFTCESATTAEFPPPRPWYPESVATTVDPENKAQAPKAGFLTVVVDADEYEKALLDPLVHQTNLEATEFLERLEREGRSL